MSRVSSVGLIENPAACTAATTLGLAPAIGHKQHSAMVPNERERSRERQDAKAGHDDLAGTMNYWPPSTVAARDRARLHSDVNGNVHPPGVASANEPGRRSPPCLLTYTHKLY